MHCLFLRRGFKVTDTVKAIFDTVTDANGKAINSENGATLSLTTSDIPQSGTVYLFETFKGSLSVWKIVDGVLNTTPLAKVVGSSARAGIHNRTSNGTLYLRDTSSWYTEGTSNNGTVIYGGDMLLLTFSRSDAIVDRSIKDWTLTTLAGKNISTTSLVSVPVSTAAQHKWIIAQGGACFDVWQSDGSTLTKVFNLTATAESKISGSNLIVASSPETTSQSPYGCTICAID